MNILICDDNEGYLNQIDNIVKNWLENNGIDAQVYATANVHSAINVAGFSEYQIAFVDVEMPDMNGFEFTKVLRKKNPDIIIIMITNYTNYVYDAFSFQVYSYIYKDDMDIKIPDILGKAIGEITDFSKMFTYKIQRETYMINTRRIMYFQVNLHHMEMYTEGGMVEFVEPMKNVETRLNKDIFVRINRNNIVNVRFVEEVTCDYVLIGGNVKLPISNKYMKELQYKRLQWYGSR